MGSAEEEMRFRGSSATTRAGRQLQPGSGCAACPLLRPPGTAGCSSTEGRRASGNAGAAFRGQPLPLPRCEGGAPVTLTAARLRPSRRGPAGCLDESARPQAPTRLGRWPSHELAASAAQPPTVPFSRRGANVWTAG